MIGSLLDSTRLNNGVEMPWLGLGTWQSAEGDPVRDAVKWAVDAGYRHIDTAAIYGNEAGVGQGVRDCGVPRDDLFVTTKLWNEEQRKGRQRQALEESLERLGMDCVDLYLIHWPVAGKWRESWAIMEQAVEEGLCRAIGVSNFHEHHLKDLMASANVVPAVNQVEFHPYLVQTPLRAFCKEQGIQFEGWAPMMRGKVGGVQELIDLAAKYNKSPHQLVLRWSLQHEVVTIPKSVTQQRIADNANLFDFEIADEDMAAIDALDCGERTGPDPDNFDF